MRHVALLLLALSGLAFAPPASTLPTGDGRFRLGMTRVELDSVIARRGLRLLSAQANALACASDDPRVEYERYAFVTAADGARRLWKVTLGYRLPYTPEDLAAIEAGLVRLLGEPRVRSEDPADDQASVRTTALAWTDAVISVQLGGRWPEIQDPSSDRMLVTWVDRRLQRLTEVRRRSDGRTSGR